MRIASWRRRLLASLIDLIVSVFAGLALIAGGVAWAFLRERAQSADKTVDADAIRRAGPWRLSVRQQAILWIASMALGVLGRNWRSPGFRLLRLRRVDVRTGGPVTIRSALIVQTCDRAWGAMSLRLTRGPLRRQRERSRERREALTEILLKCAGGPQRRQQAVASFLEENPSISSSTYLWPLLPEVLWRLLPALWVRQGRTVRDRVTGTAVVVEA